MTLLILLDSPLVESARSSIHIGPHLVRGARVSCGGLV